ncbi:MAG: glycoside hydrolase family 3 protein [Candidatus Melainabacteria bacterium]
MSTTLTPARLPERLAGLPVEQQVAQLFMVGFEGPVPDTEFLRWMAAGVGGVIFFRENLQHLTQPAEVAQGLSELSQAISAVTLPPFLSVDQEGGRIERLPFWLFPSLPSPMAVGSAANPVSFAKEVTGVLASQLARLGFNMNFAPTLDVNLNPRNPIIGVRAFGARASEVTPLVADVLAAYRMHGVVAVGKHFPGHGNGLVDSHLTLPELTFTEEELRPFEAAVAAGIPAMLISHGWYPALQSEKGPASLSKKIATDLLRERCGFPGLLISDDMTMGAVAGDLSAGESAVAALNAGVDMLIYKAATPAVWQAYEAVLSAVQSGDIPRERFESALLRVAQAKQFIQPFRYRPEAFANWRPAANAATALDIARRSLRVRHEEEPCLLPLHPEQTVLLIHPDRGAIHHYQPDQVASPELPALLRECGMLRLRDVAYDPRQPVDLTVLPEAWRPTVGVFVTLDPLIFTEQLSAFEALQSRYPELPWLVVSASTDAESPLTETAAVHLALCSYRPSMMAALAERLTGAVVSV